MLKGILALAMAGGAAFGGIINPNAADPSLFRVTTFAGGLNYPAGFQPLPDGSLAVQTSLNFGAAQGQLFRFTDVQNQGVADGPGTLLYQSGANGIMAGSVQVGNLYAMGNDGERVGLNGDHSISLLLPGATPASPMTAIATLQFNYPQFWEHDQVGMAVRPTPGVPGSYDLIVNIGAQGDNTATPANQLVTLTGTGFSSFPTTNLSGDSLYMITIDENGAQPLVTSIKQIATGIRNVFGMAFDPSTGDLYFADNAMDAAPPGSLQPAEPDGEPPQADELNVIPAASLGIGPAPDYGFPNCYTQYAYGGVPAAPVGSGCVQPVLAFQPVVDGSGTHELEGPTQMTFAPAGFPAGFNHGIFIGFMGEGFPTDEAGLGYFSFDTHQYIQFIQASTPGIDNVVGVTATANALFLSDPGPGNVIEISAASTPEPASGGLVLFVLTTATAFSLRRRPAPRRSARE